MRERLRELYNYKELLLNLVRKEIKVKYKNSFFGFLWSLINPLVMLVVFYVAFGVIFKLRSAGMQYYAFFLMSGILAWNFLSNSLAQAVASVVGNGVLVKKVYFPREVLPLSYIGSAGFHFLLQEMVLLVFLIVFGVPLTPWILAFPLVLLLQVVFIIGVVLWISAVNVFFRDVQHFTEIFLMAWFWMTPVIYPIGNMLNTLPSWAQKIYLLNPMAHIILLFQYIVYNSAENAPDAVYINPWAIAGVAAVSVFLTVTGYFYFTRREGKFAEFV
jgi:lipopolysaccharide transport system permease protein